MVTTWGELRFGQVTPSNRKAIGQGYFRYYRPDGSFEALVAVGGKLLLNGGDLTIEGLPDGFQKERMIEGVQYNNILYLATGTKLLQYDGTVCKIVDPYTPQPLEALYVGLNGLAEFPDQFITDGEGSILQVNGVTVDKRKGVLNEESTFKGYITKPPTMSVVYKWQVKRSEADTFIDQGEWVSDKKEFRYTFDEIATYDIRLLVKEASAPDTEVVNYTISGYSVTRYDENEVEDYSGIHSCNRILLHWDRIILYGDTSKKNLVYISHVKNPSYFPVTNTLAFETDRQEPITKIVRFRDFLVSFMPSNIQALYGKSPQEYARAKIHTEIGCIAPESPAVLGNSIAFLAKDGAYVLKSFGNSESRMNVDRIDDKIANLLPNYTESVDACGIVHDSQYHVCFPQHKKRFRYYIESKNWTKDVSPYFDFCRMYEWQGDLVAQSKATGEVFQFDKDTYDDLGYVYEDRIETKSYDHNIPYNPKKFKELHLLMSLEKYDTNLSVDAYGDDSARLLTTDLSYITVEGGEVRWNKKQEPNVKLHSGTVFGQWNLGKDGFGEIKVKTYKLRLLGGKKHKSCRVVLQHKEPKPYSLLGLGFVFKINKP